MPDFPSYCSELDFPGPGWPDSEIDFSDIPEVTEETWNKTTLECVRVDAEVMEWILRQSGPDRWEDKLNDMLRRAMAEEREAL